MKIIETCPKCGHDLVDLVLTTNPPIPQKKCFNCGWEWTGEREEVVRVPFGGNTYTNTTDTETISLNDYINTTTTEVTLNGGVDGYIVECYVPVQPSDIPLNRLAQPCKHCSNNPRNGGSGICNCTLGSAEIRY